MNPTRRQFLGRSFGMFFGITAVNTLLSMGCKGSDGYGDSGNNAIPVDNPNPQSGDCNANGRQVTYKNPGHAHTAINLPKEMVDAATPGFYSLLSGSHDHDFEITAEDFAKLKNGETTTKQETDHGHIVAISC